MTAARSLTGKTVTISKLRQKPLHLPDGTMLSVTVHPSSLLRIKDEADKRAAYKSFVADLKKAAAKSTKIAEVSSLSAATHGTPDSGGR